MQGLGSRFVLFLNSKSYTPTRLALDLRRHEGLLVLEELQHLTTTGALTTKIVLWVFGEYCSAYAQ